MRIYQVLAPARFGGAETVCLSLSAALRAIGVDCTLLMLVSGSAPDELILRAQRLELPITVFRHGPRSYYDDIRALRRLVGGSRDVVLHAHLARANLVTRGAAVLTRCPCVATLHGHFGGAARDRFHDLADRTILEAMDAVVTVSYTAAAAARARSQRMADRFVAIPSGLLPEAGLTRAGARNELGLMPDATIVGWVGRFVPQKNPELFVQAVAELARRSTLSDPWQAVMVGDGPLLSTTREVARALGVSERITFSGFRADAGRVVSAFDALLVTSHGEELPTVILECLHAGVPVVSTGVGDVPYIARHCAAVRLSAASAGGFADNLGELLAVTSDRARAAVLARAYVTRFHDPERWAERHRELYARLLGRRHNRRTL